MTISACGGKENEQTTTTTTTTTAQETTSAKVPQADSPGSLSGTEILAAKASDIVPEGLSFAGADLRTAEFSVYKNKYPVGQAGALFELTAEIDKQITDNFVRFAGLLGYKLDGKNYTTNGKIYFYDESTGIYSHAESVSIDAKNDEINSETSAEKVQTLLKTDKTLKAACEFAGIPENAKVFKTVSYNVNNEISEVCFLVTQQADSAAELAENTGFRGVRITCYRELNSFNVRAFKLNHEKAEIKFTPVTFDEAVSECAEKYLQSTGKKADSSALKVCSAEYSAKVYRDYYVPCYVFTLEVENSAKSSTIKEFEQYYIPMYTSAEAEVYSAG